MLRTLALLSICGLISVQAQTVSFSSRVTRNCGGGVPGATISLVGAPAVTTLSNVNGDFTLSNSTAIWPNQAPPGYSFSLLGDGITLSLTQRVASGRVEFFAWDGKATASFPLHGMDAGKHKLALPRLAMGIYFMRVEVDGSAHAHRLLHVDGRFLDATSRASDASTANKSTSQSKSGVLAKTSAAVVDTLLVTKAGYENLKIPLVTLMNPKVLVIMKPLCTIPTLARISALPAIAKFPDPFKMLDGSRITTKDQWCCRRAEIDRQFQTYELGIKPPRPATTSGSLSANRDTLTITVGDGTKTMFFKVTISRPATGTGPFPVLIGIGGSNLSDVRTLGVATINFNNNEFAANTNGSGDRNRGKYYDFISTHDSITAGALMAWAWGVSRIIDALELMPEANLDPTRVAVTGCSRNGKGAIVAGAFDERIALTIPHESGSGGAASWRASDFTNSTAPNTAQALNQIVGEQPWFSLALNVFATGGRTNQLPVDHHMLAGLVSPRALFIYENSDYAWLGATSTINNAYGARPIFQALGTTEEFAYSQLNGTGHCSFNATIMQPWVTSYVTKYLLGGAATKAATIEWRQTGFTFDAVRWIDWTTPTLL